VESGELPLTPYPPYLYPDPDRISGTVASSPRAVTDRLLGCVGTVLRIQLTPFPPRGSSSEQSMAVGGRAAAGGAKNHNLKNRH